MNYPPELIEDFEKKFPDFHSGLYWNRDKSFFFWVDGEHDDNLMHRKATERMALLQGYAHNWHRVRELEEIVEAVAHIGIDFGYGPYELEDRHIEAARKLLEKGNE